ncbi:Regulatory protein RecX [Ferriphaselus amnicola]|uniref:Regulatory protein RecX n=1 Tax=Ferriphaselus amnicola TaxID=1188319 RepID=A0A2Z6GB94_9PROT|nr:recombination regulator RecX [Ferriphaselus amnicola]BBE50727.1 Regulatory protein RecX [Ferriphaselus amnicola]
MVAKKTKTSLHVRAMQYLARREHSRVELYAKLARYAEPEDDVPTLLDQLAEQGWLSDQRAAEQTVRIKRSRFGTKRIVQELRQKGIADTLIAEAIPELRANEMETAREVWRKKFGEIAHSPKENARQIRFLQSRGFSLDVIFGILKLSDQSDMN